MNLFYSHKIEGDQVYISDLDLNHLRVLRVQPGDTIQVITGDGNLYKVQLSRISKKESVGQIMESQFLKKEDRPYLHLAIAPTKNNDRTEFFLEKAVELGVDEVSFFISKHSERKKINPERMQKIMLSAAKQSKCYHFPTLHFNKKIEEVLALEGYAFKGIAHCEKDSDKLNLTDTIKEKNLILIGPEGDFINKEILLAKSYGFKAIDLGLSRLRTETAGIYVCAAFRCTNLSTKALG